MFTIVTSKQSKQTDKKQTDIKKQTDKKQTDKKQTHKKPRSKPKPARTAAPQVPLTPDAALASAVDMEEGKYLYMYRIVRFGVNYHLATKHVVACTVVPATKVLPTTDLNSHTLSTVLT